jgi:hypothetical protein
MTRSRVLNVSCFGRSCDQENWRGTGVGVVLRCSPVTVASIRFQPVTMHMLKNTRTFEKRSMADTSGE